MAGKISFFLFIVNLMFSGALAAQTEAPSYPFARNFVPGIIFLNDGSQKSGTDQMVSCPGRKITIQGK